MGHPSGTTDSYIQSLLDRIEALEKEVLEWKKATYGCAEANKIVNDNHRAEIERLREALRNMLDTGNPDRDGGLWLKARAALGGETK